MQNDFDHEVAYAKYRINKDGSMDLLLGGSYAPNDWLHDKQVIKIPFSNLVDLYKEEPKENRQYKRCEFYDTCPSCSGWCNYKNYDKDCVPFLQIAIENMKENKNE